MAEKWIVVARDYNSPYLRNHIWTSNFDFWGEFDLPKPAWGIISRNNDIEYVGKLSLWQKAGKILFDRVHKDPKLFDKIIAMPESYGKSMTDFTRTVFNQDLSKVKTDKLISYYEKFREMQAREYANGLLLAVLDIGNPIIESELNKILKKHSRQELYDVYTYPAYNSFNEENEIALLKLAIIFKKNPGLDKLVAKQDLNQIKSKYPKFYDALKKHTDEYAWIYYVYEGPALKIEDFLKQIAEMKNPKETLKGKIKIRKEKDDERKKYLKVYRWTSYEKKILLMAGTVVWSKPRRKDWQSIAYYHTENLIAELGRRFGLNLEHARATPIEMFRSGKIDRKKIKDILRLHACIPQKGGGVKLLIGEEVEEFIENNMMYEKHEVANADTLKGTVACLGPTIEGIARIINKPQEMDKMQEGDILVSVATTPAIVPAMKKAAAIVTDEGGLCCHAAIVSREMNKPCIVGLKCITEIVKDGDIIEVNTENSQVRIVKRR